MPHSLASSERSGSVKSHHSPKTSLQSKADPNMALYEQEPSAFLSITLVLVTYWPQLVAVNLQQGARDAFSLRSIQHKDRDGNVICKTTPNTIFSPASYPNQLQPILIAQIPPEAVSSDRLIPYVRSMLRSTLIASNNACEQCYWIPIQIDTRERFFMLNYLERGVWLYITRFGVNWRYRLYFLHFIKFILRT